MTLDSKLTKMFKKRGAYSYKEYRLRYGDAAIFINKETRVEIMYLVFLKKIVKTLLKKLKRYKNKPKVWIYWQLNYTLTKKSKNARMGKGKGDYIRRTIRVKSGWPLIEFYGLHINVLNLIFKKLIKKTNLNLTFIKNRYPVIQATTKPNLTFEFCKKYWTL